MSDPNNPGHGLASGPSASELDAGGELDDYLAELLSKMPHKGHKRSDDEAAWHAMPDIGREVPPPYDID
jgi:hypothetical protein